MLEQTPPERWVCTETRYQKRREREKANSFHGTLQRSKAGEAGFEYACYETSKGQLISDSSRPPKRLRPEETALPADLSEVAKRKVFLNLYLTADSTQAGKDGAALPSELDS